MLFVTSTHINAKIKPLSSETIAQINSYYKELKIASQNLEARFELAMVLAYNGRIEKGWEVLSKLPKSYAVEVIKKYEPLIESDPNEWKHCFKLAFGYYFQKRRDESISMFKKVLNIEAKQVWAMAFIALLEGEMKRNKEAIKWCQKALKIDKDATAIHFLIAEAYRREGNYFGTLKSAMIVGRLKTEEIKMGIDKFEEN